MMLKFKLKARRTSLAGIEAPSQTPIFSFEGHGQEGYAMDCPTHPGRLITGDCDRNIHLFEPLGNANAPSSVNGSTPFLGHTASVEDLQWSPTEKTVFASCSMDHVQNMGYKAARQMPAFSLEAHEKM